MDRLPFAGFSLSEAGQLYARSGVLNPADRRARSLAITEEAWEVLPLLRKHRRRITARGR